jgi:hypothetical protein
MPRPIQRDRHIALERLAARCGKAAEVGRPRFFLAVEHDTQAPRRPGSSRAQRVHCVEQRDDRALVVGCGSAVNAPLRIERRRPRIETDGAARSMDAWRKGSAPGPLRGVDRLSVVMDVKGDDATRRRRVEAGEHHRRARSLRLFDAKPSPCEQRFEQVGVAPHVGVVAGHVGNRHQLQELLNDLSLVLRAPLRDRPRLRGDTGGCSRDNQQQPG